jgi:hypothetical protein
MIYFGPMKSLEKMDRVLTVNDFYDLPRVGIAELNGVPHIYEGIFDESLDEYSDTYYLSPIDQDLLLLALEDWEIWIRWQRDFNAGKITLKSHPALPEDRSRHEEIRGNIGDRFRTDPLNRILVKGSFKRLKPGRNDFVVEWSGDIK